MSRQRFGSWGAHLSDAEFACALAALGMRRANTDSDRPESPRRTMAWLFEAPEASRPAHRLPPIADLVTEWRAVVARSRQRLVLEVPVNTYAGWVPGADPAWLVQTLKLAEGVSSVVLSFEASRAPRRRWDWPIDIGYLEDAESDALRVALDGHHAWSNFTRHIDAVTTDAQIDILLFPGSLAEAVSRFARAPRLPEIHTVLVLGGNGRARDPIASLAVLRADANAVAAGVIDLADTDKNHWLGGLLYNLAHDLSLDEALFAASAGPLPLLLGPDRGFEQTRASAAAKDLVRRMTSAPLPAGIDAVTDVLERVGLPPQTSSKARIESLERDAEKLDWSRETEAASAVVELARAERTIPVRTDARFVQAQVHTGNRTLHDEPLVSGAAHRLDVRVGHTAEGWISSSAAFPAEELPPTVAGHTLTIVLVAPSVLDEPQTTTIWLPARGNSETCAFHFVARPGITSLDARVTVLYENRILQTLRIRAAVGTRPATGPALSIDLETVLRASLGELSGSAGFDASFFLNDMEGERGLTAFGASTAFVKLDGVQGALKSLRDELEKITKSPEDYEKLSSDEVRELLVTLARAGVGFGKALRRLPRMESALIALGDQPGRVQVTSIHPDELVPLEFIYDRPFPLPTATLCPGLLAGGTCSDACPRNENTVCARGFWGLRHVVERRLYNETDAVLLQSKGADYAFGAEPGQHRPALATLRTVLLGTAEKASNFDPVAFEDAVGRIKVSLTGANAKLIRTSAWKTWATEVESGRPDLLVLITHTEEELGAAVLELGASDHLAAAQIEALHVSEPPPAHPSPGPIVFLLGCRTAMKEVPFSDFISAFREARASVVLATISTVRGRHMAPLALEAVELMLECQRRPRCSVGEFVRDLRYRALARNLPVGLALVAYGEVDWQIGGSR